MHHANMVHDVVSGLHEFLHQEQVLTKNTKLIEAQVNHVANEVQNTQQQLATQLKKMQAMMQAICCRTSELT